MFSTQTVIRVIRVISILIMCATMYLSFGHQRNLFLSWQVDLQSSLIAPLTIDLLAIACSLGIHADGIDRKGRVAATIILLLAGSASMSANFLAGSTPGSKIVNVWCVVAYLGCEWLANRMKGAAKVVDSKRSAAARKAAATRAANKQRKTSQAKRQRVAAAVAQGNVVPMTRSGSVAA